MLAVDCLSLRLKRMSRKNFRRLNDFLHGLRARVPLRAHMNRILLVTVAAGFLATHLMLLSGVESRAARYFVAILISYVTFFCAIRFWLSRVVPDLSVLYRDRHSGEDPEDLTIERRATEAAGDRDAGNLADLADLAEVAVRSSRIAGDVTRATQAVGRSLRGGGGRFGGGGASGSWSDGGTVHSFGRSRDFMEQWRGHFGDMGDVRGARVSGRMLVVLAIVLFAAAIFGGIFYVIYQAPVILMEVALEYLLSFSLLRGLRRTRKGLWWWQLLRSTWLPFVLIFGTGVFCGLVLDTLCRDQLTLLEAINSCPVFVD